MYSNTYIHIVYHLYIRWRTNDYALIGHNIVLYIYLQCFSVTFISKISMQESSYVQYNTSTIVRCGNNLALMCFLKYTVTNS